MDNKNSIYISNASSCEIKVRVTVNQSFPSAEYAGINVGGILGFFVGRNMENVYQNPGFVKIAPGKSLAFNVSGTNGKVWVSAKSKRRQIAENYQPLNNRNVIIDKNEYLQVAQEGQIWVDTHGQDHKITQEHNNHKVIIDKDERVQFAQNELIWADTRGQDNENEFRQTNGEIDEYSIA